MIFSFAWTDCRCLSAFAETKPYADLLVAVDERNSYIATAPNGALRLTRRLLLKTANASLHILRQRKRTLPFTRPAHCSQSLNAKQFSSKPSLLLPTKPSRNKTSVST
jgi:hypothetical protein